MTSFGENREQPVALVAVWLQSRALRNGRAQAMPTRALPLILLFLFAVSALPALPRQSLAAERPAGEPVGELVDRVGSVVVLRNAGSGRLATGDPIFAEDLIVTGTEARARLRFADGTVLSIGSGSQLAVVEYLEPRGGAGRGGVLSLLIGIVRAVVSPDEERRGLEIDTRVAVASVRSTDLMVEAGAGGAAVVTLEGEVAVASKPPGPVETVVLTDGMGTDVPPDGPPSPPARWGDARVTDFIDRTRVP